VSLDEIKKELNRSHKDDSSNSSKVNLLAQRVVDVVKGEIYDFFKE
jgi:hypothetical protein